ncbi:D-alanyl-D-alanine carboxypeptidase family protein [Hespellia stercorisuis]|uniref:serine-type D-Ala-D-Ala carboxypeptidase n=1 Tax=Hespellia stercorisuis DSM 15480 TaxID=1121950 RepID=A0A1M6HK00_9FIRM|nr:D-alanyl-D-alanine carboxypeptidase family protein [Hespellia stercorisuis]SHJ22491.1 D-alanyl-D-alanine carboxypeptidase (penicillin-binding protein 5/6) [Hespellia stercorisuis DSM 15480]
MKIWLALYLSGVLALNQFPVCVTPQNTSCLQMEQSETDRLVKQEETDQTNVGEQPGEQPGAQPGMQPEGIEIGAPSALLMEASTGEIVCEKNADEERPPASVTKVMTLLLIFDALEDGKISLTDEVTTSEYAASMGGSQVFLETGEKQTVETLIKCIAVASANDACVALGEYIAGSEQEFVARMNERAKGLGMEHTHFVNCNGLDAEGHLTTARDIALMSRELINRYPQVHEYSMIWMENITHNTAKGSSEFGLSNTNKLVRQYEYTTGLKTGSTGEAKFCISATAKKNEVELIAVIMAAPDPKTRFQDAVTLLNYGFGKCQLYRDAGSQKLKTVPVTGGKKEQTTCIYESDFTHLFTKGEDISKVTSKITYKESVKAPVKKGMQVGTIRYLLDGTEIGNVKLVADEEVKRADFMDYLKKLADRAAL